MLKPNSPLLSLMWKEMRQVAPLAILLAGTSAVVTGLLWLMYGETDDSLKIATSTAMSVLLPNLFALGAPILMIGHEEETGTLAWTRSLPIGWKTIFFSKWIVALLGLGIAWGISIACYQLVSSGAGPLNRDFTLTEHLDSFLTFSLTLLATGFSLAWWIRKPVLSLLLLLPTITTISIGCSLVVAQWYRHRATTDHDSTPLMLATAFGLFLLSGVLAHRVWTKPWGGKLPRSGKPNLPDMRPYRPTSRVPLLSPGPRTALLWQHARQSLPITGPAFAVGLLAALSPTLIRVLFRADGEGLQIAGTYLAVMTLGAATFLTDSIGSRHRFLSDRGLSTWRVWWTRQALPLALSLIIVTIAYGVALLSSRSTQSTTLVAMLATAFVSGQLTAMLARRPSVGLLAAPLMTALCGFSVVPLAALYGAQLPMPTLLAGGMVVLWLTTLRVCRFWMEDRRSRGFYLRTVGWIAAAALLAIGSQFAQRWFTTPAAMPQWQQRVLAKASALPPAENDFSLVMLPFPHLPLATAVRPLSEPTPAPEPKAVAPIHLRRLLTTLRQTEFAGDAPSPSRDRDAQEINYQDSLTLLMQTRDLYRGSQQLSLSDLADEIDLYLANELTGRGRHLLKPDQWNAFVAQLPTPEQLTADRRAAVLRSYSEFDAAYRSMPPYPTSIPTPVSLGEYPMMSHPRHVLGLERYRTRRLIDRAIRASLDALAGSDQAASDEERLQAWARVWEGDYTPVLPTSNWDQGLSRKITTLRASQQ